MTKARRNYHRPQGQILLKSFNKHTNSQDQIVGLQVMMAIKSAHSTNPKDKVIGVQAIVQQIGLTLPLLTYAMGESELFTILTTYWMSHWSSLQLLSLTATSAIADDVPTWVVRWDECEQESGNMITGRYSRLVYLQAMNSVINQETSATSKYPMPAHTLHRSLTSRELVLQGWVLTTIRTFVLPSGVSQRSMLGSESAQEVERERTTSLARTVRTNIRWASFLITLCGEKNVKAAMHAFASIMNIGPEQLVSFGYQTSNLLYRDLQFMANFSEHLTENDQDLLQKFIAKSRDHLNNDHQDLLEGLGSIDQRSIWPILRARTEVETLFTTADGRLGLCYSRPIQQGDSIVLVAGSDFPLIVRPSPSDADKYVFLGPAVVSGPCDDATMEKDRARGRDPRTPRMVALADDMYRKWYRKPGHEFAAIGSLMRGDEWLANASIGTMSEFVLV